MHYLKIGILVIGAAAVGVAIVDDIASPKLATKAVSPSSEPAPQDELSTLIPNCTPGGGVSCTDDLYQKVWLRIEADNGEVTKVDTKSIHNASTGAAQVVVYTYVPHTRYNPAKLRRLFFDCAGQFQDDTEGLSTVMDAPPNSVAGKIASIACAGAKYARPESVH